MNPASDTALIEEYAATRSETAFRELVDRHIDHVHSVAYRVMRNHALAADVAQQVFTKLATDHGKIPCHVSLPAWLHVKTRSLAIDMVRSEEARRRREQDFQLTAKMNEQDVSDWSELEPLIDEVIGSLPTKDRDAILLRFYQKKSHATVGQILGVSEDAARMRINRALEKVRAKLSSRGIATTTAALALTLPANAVTAAPPALAATVSSTAVSAALAGAAASSGVSISSTLLSIAKTYIALITVLAVSAPVVVWQFVTQSRLGNELSTLHQSIEAIGIDSPLDLPLAGDTGRETGRPGVKKVPALTLRSILAQGDPRKRTQALLNYVQNVAPQDIPATLKELRVISSDWDPEAGMLIHMMLTRWAQEDPIAAHKSLSALDLRNMAADACSILGGLAAGDPEQAAAWIADPDNALVNFPNMGNMLAGTVAKEWGRRDQSAALQWAHSLPDNQRIGAYTGILGNLAASDPQTASTVAMQLPQDDGRSYLVGEIATAWARQSPDNAMAWVQTLEGNDRTTGFSKALTIWGEMDPIAAARFVDQLSADENVGPHVASLAGAWATQAPAQAAAWVASHPEGPGKNAGMSTVMWNWTMRDPEAASQWLAQQPSGASKDEGINGLASAAFDTDPAAALNWASEIVNPALRTQSVELGLRTWLYRDPAAARHWANRHHIDLPEN